MNYLALYRKWRPQNFRDIVGQKHIVVTLENAIKNKRIAHAYLFCGPRGTGKTSTAKVLAKALNCTNLNCTEPCNACDSCLSISSGASIDVIEIDAASNRGIDEIRDLKEKIKFAPSGGKYKIYIVDEVHMLTNEAFNALLKTLEEPPEHAIFILATTEPQKVPLTILSRCQRFDFKSISVQDIVSRLEEVVKDLKLAISPAALDQIARAAEGGLRDSLSILDQIVTFSSSDKITEEDIHNLLGTVNKDIMNAVLEYLLKGDISNVLQLISQISSDGKDLRLFVKEFTGYIRGLLLNNIAPAVVSNKDANTYGGQPACESEFLLAVLDVLIEHESKMKWSSQPRVILELAFIKLLARQKEGRQPNKQEKVYHISENGANNGTEIKKGRDNSENTGQPEKNYSPGRENTGLEQSASIIKEVAVASEPEGEQKEKNTAVNQANPVTEADPGPAEADRSELKKELNSGPRGSVSINRVKQAWKDIVKEVKQAKSAISVPVSNSIPLKIEKNMLFIGLRDEFHKQWLDKNPKNKELIQQVIKSVLGWECIVKFTDTEIEESEEQVPGNDPASQSVISLFEAQEVTKS